MNSEHKTIQDITHGLAAVRKVGDLNEVEVANLYKALDLKPQSD